MCRHYDYLIDTPRNELPHGRRDLPARIVGWLCRATYNCPDTNCRLGARATGGRDESNTFRREGKAMGTQRMYAPTLPF